MQALLLLSQSPAPVLAHIRAPLVSMPEVSTTMPQVSHREVEAGRRVNVGHSVDAVIAGFRAKRIA